MSDLLKHKKPFIFGAYLSVLIILTVLGPWINNSLAWSRSGISGLQLWRIITGHLVHTNLWHGLLNASALAIALYLFGDIFSAIKWLLYFAIVGLFISIALFLFNPELEYYVGLSGVLYGIFALGLLVCFKENPILYGLVFLGLSARVVSQQLPGFDPDYLRDSIQASVIVDAHLYGYICGIFLSLFFLASKIKKPTRANKK